MRTASTHYGQDGGITSEQMIEATAAVWQRVPSRIPPVSRTEELLPMTADALPGRLLLRHLFLTLDFFSDGVATQQKRRLRSMHFSAFPVSAFP